MPVWFEGSGEIATSIQTVKDSFQDLGAHYVGVIGLMPGLTTADLDDQGDDFVTIRTNEGVMNRTNISIRVEAEGVFVEFDEEYVAGSVTATSHFLDEFTVSSGGVTHHTVISGVQAPGLLGFFYRKFGSSNTGNAFLQSYKSYFEEQSG